MPFQRGAPKGNRNRFVHGLYSKALSRRGQPSRLDTFTEQLLSKDCIDRFAEPLTG